MGSIAVRDETITLDEPTLVEGLPGVGLVGKIAADHLVEELDLDYYADVVCDGIPEVSIYAEGDHGLRPPVRLYADGRRGLVVLQSDVPVSPGTAPTFAGCVAGWLEEQAATPVFLSGLPHDRSDGGTPPALFGVATGDGAALLDRAGIDAPDQRGVVSGPTGALLHTADQRNLTAVGLVVQSDPRFPDPEAAHILLRDGIEPLVGIDVDTSGLVDRAEEIRDQKERLAKRMGEADDESSRAEPLRMYQ